MKQNRMSHTMGIRVDDKTLNRLEALAKKEKRTVSNLVRFWIDEHIEKESKLKKAS